MKNPQSNFTIMPNELLDSNLLSSDAKILYLTIARFDPSRPTYNALQARLGWGREKISKYLKELVRLKLVSYVKGKQRMANQYKTTFNAEEWKAYVASKNPAVRNSAVLKSNSNNTKYSYNTYSSKIELLNSNDSIGYANASENKTNSLSSSKIEPLEVKPVPLLDPAKAEERRKFTEALKKAIANPKPSIQDYRE